jgi:hypothetical protein
LLDATIDTDEVLAEVDVTLILALPRLEALLELHKIREALLVETFLEAELPLPFLARPIMHALL